MFVEPLTAKSVQHSSTRRNAKDLINEVVYLASLVSDLKAIDPLLDRVRIITAATRLTEGRVLTKREYAELQHVNQAIRDYLIQNDSLRSFTPASLQRHLDSQVAQAGHLWLWPRSAGERIRLVALILALSLLFILPLPLTTRTQLAMPVFMIGAHLWITNFFWLARRDFRSRLRRAYVYICIGVLMTGITIAQYPVASAFGLLESPLYIVGGFTPGFALAFGMMYVGLCIFARVLSLRTILISIWWTGGTVIVVLFAVVILSSLAPKQPSFLMALSVTGSAVCAVFALYGALLAQRIAQHTTIIYAHGMNLFATTLYMVTLGSFLYAAIVFVTGNLVGLSGIIAMTPFIISEFFMLRTGYTFYRIS